MKVSLADPQFGDAERAAVDEVMKTGMLTMGKRVKMFEEQWAKYCGVNRGIMTNSGSSANLLAMSILKELYPKGGEVITPAITWATTILPISQTGFTPVLVDVDYDYNISLDAIRKAITWKTKAIMPVHLLGNPARMPEIMEIAEERDLLVIEDCCEAHGAMLDGKKVGSFGDMGTFSFYASHHISTIEGGMIVTNNTFVDDELRSLRAFGWTRDTMSDEMVEAMYGIDPRFCFVNPGYNLRPTELNAAIGLVQLPRLEENIKRRRENASWYWRYLPTPTHVNGIGAPDRRHVFLLYPFQIGGKKQKLVDFLEKNGIETRPIISGNMARQPVMQKIKHRISGKLVNAELAHDNGFCIGVHPGIGETERNYIRFKMQEFFKY